MTKLANSGTKLPGEHCPQHGWYLPSYSALDLRRRATADGVPDELARKMLTESERLRRACPTCPGSAPNGPVWAATLRLRMGST
jgi:hypothetical protein